MPDTASRAARRDGWGTTMVHAEISRQYVVWHCDLDQAEYAVADCEAMLSDSARAFIKEHSQHAVGQVLRMPRRSGNQWETIWPN